MVYLDPTKTDSVCFVLKYTSGVLPWLCWDEESQQRQRRGEKRKDSEIAGFRQQKFEVPVFKAIYMYCIPAAYELALPHGHPVYIKHPTTTTICSNWAWDLFYGASRELFALFFGLRPWLFILAIWIAMCHTVCVPAIAFAWHVCSLRIVNNKLHTSLCTCTIIPACAVMQLTRKVQIDSAKSRRLLKPSCRTCKVSVASSAHWKTSKRYTTAKPWKMKLTRTVENERVFPPFSSEGTGTPY